MTYSDYVLSKYPQAKECPKSTHGYAYIFDKFNIYKNITGTGGWVLHYEDGDKWETYPYAVNFDEAVRLGEEKTVGA